MSLVATAASRSNQEFLLVEIDRGNIKAGLEMLIIDMA